MCARTGLDFMCDMRLQMMNQWATGKQTNSTRKVRWRPDMRAAAYRIAGNTPRSYKNYVNNHCKVVEWYDENRIEL